MSTPIPVILCGHTEKIGAGVIALLQPEYEVVHFVLTAAAGSAQIPAILAGQPAPSDSTLGTKNYSTVPAAVILGRGYEDADIEQMMDAASQKSDAKGVPWLRPDQNIPTPPLGPEYGKALVDRLKKVLVELQVNGGMSGTKVHWY